MKMQELALRARRAHLPTAGLLAFAGLPLLLLAGLPAGAFEIAHLQLTPPDLPSTASVLSTGHAESRPLPARRRLELALVDHFGLLKPRTAERIRLEVEEIFASLDTDIGWLDPLSDPPVEAVGTRIRVILMPAPPKAWGGSGTMGVIHKSEGLVENVYIFPPAVMRTMHLKPNRLLMRNILWARALGRIVGHEIIHAIAPDHPHAKHGIMRARQSRYSLSSPELEVDALCAEVFLAQFESRSSPAQGGAYSVWGSKESVDPT